MYRLFKFKKDSGDGLVFIMNILYISMPCNTIFCISVMAYYKAVWKLQRWQWFCIPRISSWDYKFF